MTELTHITIVVSLPATALSPNARVHWSKKHSATKKYRNSVAFIARSALGRIDPPRWQKAIMTSKFYFATKRRRDKDNADASLKAARDGLADAGLVENDEAITPSPPELFIDALNPRVELTLARA